MVAMAMRQQNCFGTGCTPEPLAGGFADAGGVTRRAGID
jgi:hypothetical protein